MNARLIKARIAELGMTQKTTADAANISLSRFNAKLNGTNGAQFSLKDILALKKVLDLSAQQIDDIFLN